MAFVGAGFSRPVMPGWEDLLQAIASELRFEVPQGIGGGAFSNEMIGQMLQDQAALDGRVWRDVVRAALVAASRPAGQADLDARRRALLAIPFKAILTTNFDTALPGSDPRAYWDVLRTEDRGGWQLPTMLGRGQTGWQHPPIIKLHGDLDATEHGELVFSRADYRRLVHGDTRYANFIRALFAGYTVLFLGVSFTDAYLNELRSEVLTLLHAPHAQHGPWGYAVAVGASAETRAFFLRHESIEMLPAPEDSDFDAWLVALAAATSVNGRLETLLRGKRIVWIDTNPHLNTPGVELLEGVGAEVLQLHRPSELRAEHAKADLLLTHFAWSPTGHHRALQVLELIRTWRESPPVIVFGSAEATKAQIAENRTLCQRHGAFEYATQWSELYRLIESLFGRAR